MADTKKPNVSDVGTGPRVLLRQMRAVMAQPVEAQERLNRIVDLIAANMVAEVCSIYIGEQGEDYELFATKGLNVDAVHQTKLHVGEGLVGEIARTGEPLNLTDAPKHPKFAYRPETGEDPYHSFLGVPILKGGHVVGVLVVQNKTQRQYDEEEEEALQTVAMVLAEVAASGDLIPIHDTLIEEEVRPRHPYDQTGAAFADGLVIGAVHLHAAPIRVMHLIAEDVDAELVRLDKGVTDLQTSIAALLSASDSALPREPREVLETYQMFASDRGWLRRLREAVRNGLTAEAAVEQVQNDTRLQMSRQSDPYLRERLHDLDDLANRLLRQLTGASDDDRELPDEAVVFARNLGPADLLEYDQSKLKGVVLEEGSSFSHVSIVARALGIPLVGRASSILDHVRDGDPVVVDGSSGAVHVRPTPDVLHTYETKRALLHEQQATYASLRDQDAVTLDGERVYLNMNAGLLVDLPNIEAAGADGIGLFRTELQFMIASTMPKFSEQTDFYAQVFEACDGKPLIFRTLDLGGDKVLPYGNRGVREENPALGLRAIRYALWRPALLRYQLRALLRAAGQQPLRLMFPMISTVDEFCEAKAIFEREIARHRKMHGPHPEDIKIGCMLEVPSLIFQLDELLAHVDFVSIGSNDLFQFLFAVDRANAAVSNRYDFLNVAVLRVIRTVVEKCAAANVGVSLCGEVSGQLLEALALMGVGLRSLSMPASRIAPVKAMVRKLKLESLEDCLAEALARDPSQNDTGPGLRARLEGFLQQSGLEKISV